MSDSTNKQVVDVVDVKMPLLPLKDIVVFPHMIVPVFLNEDVCIQAVETSLLGSKKLFLSAFKVEGQVGEGLECSTPAPFDVYDVGTICSVMRTRKLPDGRMKVLIQGLQKARINSLVSTEKYPLVSITPIEEKISSEQNISSQSEALIRIVKEHLEKVVGLGKILSPDILIVLEDVVDPARLSDLIAANLGLKIHEAQSILSVVDPYERLEKVNKYLTREIEVYQMQVRIQSQAKEEIGKMQRDHFLREQMKVIRNELGDNDPRDETDGFIEKLNSLSLSKEVHEEVLRQIRRLERMNPDSGEATITRTFLETLFDLPWNTYTEDNLDLKRVKQVLDEDHYGIEKIKDRIIEYLAVKKLNPGARSPILCLVGPPGVGKTSLGKSIARAIGRKFVRISLGGVKDEADIRGHRKTYVGAYPGRIIQSIKQVKSANPLIMLDEIDKLTSDHRGDPSSALLEVLDPEQNKNFVDHYLGVPFDLSKVMFVTNANRLDTIPAPLLDRLEVIELSGYTLEEKVAIAEQYIIPKQLKETGVGKDAVSFCRNSLITLINSYTRESGLRGLEKQVASICRKLARHYAEENETDSQKEVIKLTPSMVQKYLGIEKYESDFYYTEPTSGVALGMAYTQYGGEVLAVETNCVHSGHFKLVLTGKLGDVMKESAQTALSYIRSYASDFGIEGTLIDEMEFHIHVPAGAIPKDGPSAGITIATSIISSLLKKAPKARTSMTGEITLHGKVLPIGGLKEKVLAAQREGIKAVIVPEKNKAHYNEIPLSVRKKVQVKFVKDYHEVFEYMFDNEQGAKISDEDVSSVILNEEVGVDIAS